mmetsp:Transcript_32581/g.64851  ORF Transcript_32581/g.64851 Transcript_32581/m.64851 type:complete len:281 (+) Transcript_32581:711-1553(+)
MLQKSFVVRIVKLSLFVKPLPQRTIRARNAKRAVFAVILPELFESLLPRVSDPRLGGEDPREVEGFQFADLFSGEHAALFFVIVVVVVVCVCVGHEGIVFLLLFPYVTHPVTELGVVFEVVGNRCMPVISMELSKLFIHIIEIQTSSRDSLFPSFDRGCNTVVVLVIILLPFTVGCILRFWIQLPHTLPQCRTENPLQEWYSKPIRRSFHAIIPFFHRFEYIFHLINDGLYPLDRNACIAHSIRTVCFIFIPPFIHRQFFVQPLEIIIHLDMELISLFYR